MRNLVLFCCCVLLVAGAFVPASAQAGVLEFFFPSLRKEVYDPSKTMVAPFAVGQGVEDKDKLKELPVNSVPLSQAHLVVNEIAEWVMNVSAEAMNFETNDFVAELAEHAGPFNVAGNAQYQAFLRDMNIAKVIESERYSVRSHVENTPLLLNEGLIKGRYRWLFRVPVVMTFMDRNMNGYKGDEAPITQRAMLNVQIGRIDASEGKLDGLQIEQWSGKVEPLAKGASKEK